MTNLIVAIILIAIVGGAGFYIYKEKKSGAVCIGCPHAGKCPNSCKGGCASMESGE